MRPDQQQACVSAAQRHGHGPAWILAWIAAAQAPRIHNPGGFVRTQIEAGAGIEIPAAPGSEGARVEEEVMKHEQPPSQEELRGRMRRGYVHTILTYGPETARRMLYGRIDDVAWEGLLAEAGSETPVLTSLRTPTPPPADARGMVSVKELFAAMFPDQPESRRENTTARSEADQETMQAIRLELKAHREAPP